MTRPGGFAPHIDDGGAFVDHHGRTLHRGIRMRVAITIGKGIRRHVQDAHDDGSGQIDDSMPAAPLCCHEMKRPVNAR
jgi:hypothetical protein